MRYSNLLQFPVNRNPTNLERSVSTLNEAKRPSRSKPKIIPFPGTGLQRFKSAKPTPHLSSIRVNTRLYRAFHAQSPKGIRSWGFAIGNFTESFWVQGLPFALAAKQAQKEAQRLGAKNRYRTSLTIT